MKSNGAIRYAMSKKLLRTSDRDPLRDVVAPR
jgi:hypothetical protein